MFMIVLVPVDDSGIAGDEKYKIFIQLVSMK